MKSEDLVLLRPRRQRLVEMILTPVVGIGVGPAMRALLGDAYSFYWGMGVMFFLTLGISWLGGQWAVHHGGVRITREEQRQRLIAEAKVSSRWTLAGWVVAMCALYGVAYALIFAPYEEITDYMGGGTAAFGFLALLLLPSMIPIILDRRERPQMPAKELPPADNFWSGQRADLWATLSAFTFGSAAAVAIALQFAPDNRFFAYLGTCFLISGVLRHLLLRNASPAQCSAIAHVGWGRDIMAGVTGFGLPLGVFFAGNAVLEHIDRPQHMVVAALIMLPVGGAAGAAFGALMHVFNRIA